MKCKVLFSLFVVMLLATRATFAQSVITGRVKSEKGLLLPYVNIGIKDGKLGAISDTDGKFNISIPDSLIKKTLTFSSIGFDEKSFIINSLIGKTNLEIVLKEKVTTLPEVRISNKKLRQYKLGITGRTPMVSIPTKSYQKNDILEQARLINLKKPAKILNANIFVISDTQKEVSIRLNFYAFTNGLPGKRLIERSIIKKAILKKGWFSIDLKDENVYLNEDFVVSFEYLPSDQKSIAFGAKIGAADSFLRGSSQGLWRKNVVGGCTI